MKRPVDIAATLVNDFNGNIIPWKKGSLELAVGIRIAIEEAIGEGRRIERESTLHNRPHHKGCCHE